jgi:hypothetical protein
MPFFCTILGLINFATTRLSGLWRNRCPKVGSAVGGFGAHPRQARVQMHALGIPEPKVGRALISSEAHHSGLYQWSDFAQDAAFGISRFSLFPSRQICTIIPHILSSHCSPGNRSSRQWQTLRYTNTIPSSNGLQAGPWLRCPSRVAASLRNRLDLSRLALSLSSPDPSHYGSKRRSRSR